MRGAYEHDPACVRAKALITGASSGIGAAYADRLARLGHDVVLVASEESYLSKLAERLRSENGADVGLLPVDLTNRADLLRVEDRLRDDAGITMLINSIGMAHVGSFAGVDPDDVDAIIAVNVLAATRLAIVGARSFVARGGGTIVNIASIAALMPESYEPVYLATQAYVLALSQGMYQDLAPKGICVQVVLAGVMPAQIGVCVGEDARGLPPGRAMDVTEMVDAALAGLDMGETVTIPSLPDMADWESFSQARRRLQPMLRRCHAAARYRLAVNEQVQSTGCSSD